MINKSGTSIHWAGTGRNYIYFETEKLLVVYFVVDLSFKRYLTSRAGLVHLTGDIYQTG